MEENCRDESPSERMRKGKGNEKNLTDKFLLIASHVVPGLLCSQCLALCCVVNKGWQDGFWS